MDDKRDVLMTNLTAKHLLYHLVTLSSTNDIIDFVSCFTIIINILFVAWLFCVDSERCCHTHVCWYSSCLGELCQCDGKMRILQSSISDFKNGTMCRPLLWVPIISTKNIFFGPYAPWQRQQAISSWDKDVSLLPHCLEKCSKKTHHNQLQALCIHASFFLSALSVANHCSIDWSHCPLRLKQRFCNWYPGYHAQLTSSLRELKICQQNRYFTTDPLIRPIQWPHVLETSP